nr:VraH family protein [Mammaliicoccus sp. Marseille-Q6498]
MKVKDLIKQSYEDLLDLKVTWENVAIIGIAVVVLSAITTPIIGIPVGLLGGAYYIKNEERKDND